MDGPANSGQAVREDESGADGDRLVATAALARALGVPAATLSFLEAQFPEVRALKLGTSATARAYRLGDAAFLAGLVEALYEDGQPFREVEEYARSRGRADLMRRGAARIGRALPQEHRDRPATIPRDAIVTRKHGIAERPAREPTPDILAELMGCVRILARARDPDGF